MSRDPDIELTTGISSDRPDTPDDDPDSWPTLIAFVALTGLAGYTTIWGLAPLFY